MSTWLPNDIKADLIIMRSLQRSQVDERSMKMNNSRDVEREIATLRKSAFVVVTWLALLCVSSLGISIGLLTKWAVAGITHFETQRILLCVAGGTLGSAISALVSAAERISHGWELSGGEKYPAETPKDRFVARMVPLFIIRPFLGSAMGLLVYAGVTSGYLIAVENAGQAIFSRQALLFFSFLGGLFAKTFIEKLRAMFDAFFGK